MAAEQRIPGLRPYVGQSSNTEQRIAQHVRATGTGDTDTLHYFVIRRGDGHRTANFTRPWTLALPENVDPVINTALNNILKMIMARSLSEGSILSRLFSKDAAYLHGLDTNLLCSSDCQRIRTSRNSLKPAWSTRTKSIVFSFDPCQSSQ